MTPKQELFCQEYLVSLNATQAAIKAGYSKRTAYSSGQRLLKDVEVKNRLADLSLARAKRLKLDGDDVVVQLSMAARFDIRKLFRDDGSLKPPEEWDLEAASVVQSVDFEQRKGMTDGIPVTVTTCKVRLPDRVRALEALARHHNLFADAAKAAARASGDAVVEAMERARRRVNKGITPESAGKGK